MTNILVLGANGRIAKKAIPLLLESSEVQLTLFSRNKNTEIGINQNVRWIEGDVLNSSDLKNALSAQDIVYANLSGDMGKFAEKIVRAMEEVNVKRLIFIVSLGIFDEVPGKFGKWNNEMIGEYLPSFREASDIIEASDLLYTLIRPAWLTDYDEVDYEVTLKGEDFKGTEVSRKSVAALVNSICRDPSLYVRENIGVNKPNTDGEKPAFY
ncbi:SDR family oxidoreductase [Exiguobacterium sp. s189]|uniref:SDR family oxidoreductase n=1 Tax=Exiguobacterium sp. s189 TaxID=2751263 RepID=UPI001BE906D2|nr:SDR family oxidoreductase [Exiguobacterium sp. s189]